MKNWEKGFSFQILFRAKRYQEAGRVENLIRQGNSYSATVRGGELYHVRLVYDGSYVSLFQCDCAYSKDGYRCKHMAAVLYAIDAGQATRAKAPEPRVVKPFSDGTQTAPPDYRYFNFSAIVQHIKVKESTLAKAKALLQLPHAPLEPEIEYESAFYGRRAEDEETVGSVQLTLGQGRGAEEAEIRFRKNSLETLRCTCHSGGYFGWLRDEYLACEHETALLILLKEYLQNHRFGDATNGKGHTFLDSYEDSFRGAEEEQPKAPVLRLVPSVMLEDGETRVRFRTGKEKLLFVRNIAEFVAKARQEGTLVLGKSLTLRFGEECFDEESQPLFDWLARISDDEQAHRAYTERKNRTMLTVGKTESSYPLEGGRPDDLWELMQGRLLEVQKKGLYESSGARMLRVEEGLPALSAQLGGIWDEKGAFEGVSLSGELPPLIRGAATDYVLTDTSFLRLPPEAARVLRPLFTAARDGGYELRIGRNHLGKFYHRVLPKLEKVMTVIEEEPGLLEQYVPKPVKLVFYLDIEDELARCRAKAFYGEESFSIGEDAASLRSREKRDAEAERVSRETVQRYLPLYDPERDEFRQEEPDDDGLLQLLTEGVEELRRLGEVQATDRFQALSLRRKVRGSVGIALESGVLELTITTEDLSREELKEILKSYRLKKRYHRLKSGVLMDLEGDGEALGRIMDELQLTPQQMAAKTVKVPAYRALSLSDKLDKSGLSVQRDQRLRTCLEAFETVRDAAWPLPESLKDVARGYQKAGYQWLRTLESYHFGGILADEMGLGKTLQTIMLLLAAKEEGRAGTSLIVTPASLVYNWREEIRRFAPSLIVGLLAGGARERAAMLRHRKDYDVLVTSYDLLRRDIDNYAGCDFLFEVIDEAQFIKNHTTAAAKAVRGVTAEYRFALTGTPIENRLSELWSIFDYLMPGFLYSYESFRREFETPIVKSDDAEARERLAQMVGPFILRRRKKDVLKDLPDKLEEARVAQMEGEQRLAYDAQAARILDLVQKTGEEDFAQKRFGILAELTRIRQICCDPSLILEDYKGGSAKRELVLDLVQSALEGEHRVLLFSQFTSMLDLLEQDLKIAGISFLRLDGSTPKAVRQEQMERFNGGEGQVFLISLKAGGTGLNLTGADVVIHYDPWWNEAVQNQATDRAHRIGQTRVVTVYKLLCKDTIEEKILALQESKRELADSILGAEAADLGRLTREELIDLLR